MDKSLAYYKKNRNALSIPLAFIVASIAIVMFVIIPQFSSIGEVRQQIADEEQKLARLKSSVNVLKAQDDASIDTNFGLVDNALPSGKNIVSIFTSLSGAASEAQVVLTGFSFQVGDVYTKSETQEEAPVQSAVNGVPILSVSIEVLGDNENLLQFPKLINERLPLAEVSTVSLGDGNGSYTINFFYKPYNVDQIVNAPEVSAIDGSSVKTLENIQQWKR